MRSQCRMSRELYGLEAVAYEWLNTCTIRTSVLRFVKILYYRYCGVMTILTFGFHPRSSIQNIKFTPWRRDTKTRSSFLSGMTFLRAHDSHFKILSLSFFPSYDWLATIPDPNFRRKEKLCDFFFLPFFPSNRIPTHSPAPIVFVFVVLHNLLHLLHLRYHPHHCFTFSIILNKATSCSSLYATNLVRNSLIYVSLSRPLALLTPLTGPKAFFALSDL